MRRLKEIKWVVGLVVLIGLIGFTSGVATGTEITLRYPGNLPVGHHITKGQELFAKLIEEKTKGRVELRIYPAGQLFSDKDMMKAVPAGAVEMAEVTTAQWSGLVPGLILLDLPLFFKDRRHIWRTLDGEAGEILKKDLEKIGVELLYWMDYGMMDIISRQPIRTLEDFKGKRIRVAGEVWAASIKALGAAPTFLGGGEVYMALQRGTIDGAHSGMTSFWERKTYEVAKYVAQFDYSFGMMATVMNLKKWNELPSDIQKIFLDCSKEAQEWVRKEAEKMDKECVELLKGKGMEIYVVPEKEKERWRKTNQPSIDVFLKRAGENSKVLLELAEKVR